MNLIEYVFGISPRWWVWHDRNSHLLGRGGTACISRGPLIGETRKTI
jgi:hypothetical protein